MSASFVVRENSLSAPRCFIGRSDDCFRNIGAFLATSNTGDMPIFMVQNDLHVASPKGLMVSSD